ncbi:MAG: O-antigen ligase family protein [Terracidiphilus sp.]
MFKTPQALALTGLAVAVFLSILFGMHWPGGAVLQFIEFIPSLYAYFLVCLHCNSKRKLHVLVLMMLFVCLFVIANGANDLRHGLPSSLPRSEETDSVDLTDWNYAHPYLLPMPDETGQLFYRLRGLGEINDPNDFGQILVCVIPLLFIFWRPKKTMRNFAFVILPACVLLVGIFLTHSRGALVALVAVVLVAARRRIGTLPAAILAGGLFVGAMALHFTGGRAISVDAGADRTELWSEGLQMLKSHPLFGVGIGHFMDYAVNTAHNTIVVCAAELGLFGLYFWSLFLFSTAWGALLIASPKKVGEADGTKIDDTGTHFADWKGPELGRAEINHLGYCLLLSLTGFLVAGWFLSRAYVMTFFLLGGMVEMVYEAARRRGMVAPRLRLTRVLFRSLLLMIGLITAVYILLRIINLMH